MKQIVLLLALAAFTYLGQAQTPFITLALTPSNTVQLSWTASPGAQGYRVEYRDGWGAGGWKPCAWADQWPQANTDWIDQRQSILNRFYRVMALSTVRGHILITNQIASYSATQLTSLFFGNGIPLAAIYGADVIYVIYDTISADGGQTRASGALMLPKNPGKAVPLLSHQHGTVVLTNEVASNTQGEYLLGLVWAASGYAAALPDYLGMGAGSGLHPYVHARSEATAAVDLLRLAQVICAARGQSLNGQLFLVGYSQGGQATMALHKELQTWHTNEFTITASAPMAGPHDMSGTMANLLVTNQVYGSPFYLPYTLFAYNSIYRLFESASDVLLQPYATNLPPLFDGRHSESQLNSAMPPIPSQILRPEFLQAFLTDPQNPFRAALARNDLYNWKPLGPMRLYHSQDDTTVPYANSVIAYDHFVANGATQVQLEGSHMGSHGTAAAPCFIAAKQWFDSLKQ